MTVLEIDDVTKRFQVQTGLNALLTRNIDYVHAVNGVSASAEEGQILGLVGESGCGKTTLGKLALRIYEPTSGEIQIHGRPIEDYTRKELAKNVQMVFQDPFKSLNPRNKVRAQLKEPLIVHDIPDKAERISEVLEFVNLLPQEKYLDRYLHEMSGGEKQRVAIAKAIVLEPSVIVADEPVSMLDVSIRAGILDLFKRLSSERNSTILYISHDLPTVRYICDEMLVMYLGKIMEKGPTRKVVEDPKHPYTERLLSATPRIEGYQSRNRIIREKEVPDPIELPEGCVYRDRCPFEVEACKSETMSLRPQRGDEGSPQLIACHRAVDREVDFEQLSDSNLNHIKNA